MRILFIAHRTPYPADKGDKIRAFNILKSLCRSNEVFLASFDEGDYSAEDRSYLFRLCSGVILRRRSGVKALVGGVLNLLRGRSVTEGFFSDAELKRSVERLCRERAFDIVFVFSSCMAQYGAGLPVPLKVIDIADVDSDKWRQYASTRNSPLKFVYARESETLAREERAIAEDFDRVFVVSEVEKGMFRKLNPAKPAEVLTNGVDCEYYRPREETQKDRDLVFVGVMNYFPNVDGVLFFMREVLPLIRLRRPHTDFTIVGSSPTRALRKEADRRGVRVTGRVKDVRPYLWRSRVCVVPLRVARGVQNKVLEAMAAGVPVLGTKKALEGIRAEPGRHVSIGESPGELAERALELLEDDARRDRQAASARRMVEQEYDWNICLDFLNGFLQNLLRDKKTLNR